MAAYLLANRLIPAAMPGREGMEVAAMFWTWFGLAALSLLRPVSRAWPETFALSALSFLAVPIVNMATTDRGLFASFPQGDWLFVAFDGAMLAIGATLGFAAWRAGRTKPTPAPRPRAAARGLLQRETADAH